LILAVDLINFFDFAYCRYRYYWMMITQLSLLLVVLLMSPQHPVF
jgi:hypothetical protein